MNDIVKLGFDVDSAQLIKATESMGKLRREGEQYTRESGNTERANRTLGISFGALGRALGFVSFGVAAKQFIGIADSYKAMNAGLKIAAPSTEQFARAQQALNKVAADARAPIGDIFSLYSNIAPALQEMGRTQDEVISTTDSLAKAMKLGGGDAQGHAAALRQLNQALGSGVLRGDEFNSVMENGRGIAIQLAKGLDIPIGSLRAMAAEGKLTAEVIVDAMIKQQDEINKTYNTLPIKAGEAWILVENTTVQAIGRIDEKFGVSEAWAGIIVAGARLIGQGADAAITGIDSLFNAWESFTTSLETSNEGLFVWLRGVRDGFISAGEALAPLAPYAVEAALGFAAIAASRFALVSVTRALSLMRLAVLGVTAAMKKNPFVIIGVAVGVAAKAIYDNWGPIEQFFTDMWAGMKRDAQAFVTWFKDLDFSPEAILKAFQDLWQGFADRVEVSGENLTKKMNDTTVRSLRDGVGSQEVEAAGMSAINAVLDPIIITAGEKGEQLGDAVGNAMTDAQIAAAKRAEIETERLKKKAAEAYTKSKGLFDKMSQDLTIQNTLLTDGADAARLMELGYNGMNKEHAKTILQREKDTQLLQKTAEQQQAVSDTLKDHYQAQKLQNIELTQGATAAMAARLEMDGLSAAQAANAAATQAATDRQVEFHGALMGAITNASNIKGVFTNMGEWLKSWLKQQIAYFAANKIVTYLQGSGLGGSLFGFGGLAGSGGAAGGGLIEGAPAGVGSGASVAAAGAGPGAFATAANVVAMAGAANELGKAFGEFIGAADAKKSGVGAMIAGPLGAVVGSALSGKWQDVQSGFDLGFGSGGVQGQGFVVSEKQRSAFRGTKQSTRYTDLSGDTRDLAQNYFDTLNNTITTQASALGVSGAESIMSGFTVASQRFTGTQEEISDDLQDFLTNATRDAYALAFDRMSPELAAYMSGAVDVVNGSAEDISAVFTRVASSFSSVSDAAVLLGLNFDPLSPMAIGASDALVQLLGGLDAFTTATNDYYTEYYSLEERQKIALAEAANEVAGFNTMLAAAGIESITTKEQFRTLVEGLDLTTTRGQLLFEQAMAVSGSFSAVAESGQSVNGIIGALPGRLQSSFTAMQTAANETANQVGGAAYAIRIAGQTISKVRADVWTLEEARNDGSHATGLGYVPKDGYRAELHQGEMVLPKSVANWLRGAGVPSPQGGQELPRAPMQDNGEDRRAEALLRSVEAMQEENAKLQRMNGELMMDMVEATTAQTRLTDQIRQINLRQLRRTEQRVA